MRNKIILGIDPGYAKLGWGVISVSGDYCKCLGFGIIETSPSEEMGQRLALINRELAEIIKKHKPDEIAIEELFFGRNARTAIKVAHARGVIMMCAVEHTGRIFEYKPANVKLAIVGAGNAQKPQVQARVQEILMIEELPKQQDDAADALAIALAHVRLTQP
jgi:crossover junction endodeoxyribonuclease RuvC